MEGLGTALGLQAMRVFEAQCSVGAMDLTGIWILVYRVEIMVKGYRDYGLRSSIDEFEGLGQMDSHGRRVRSLMCSRPRLVESGFRV